jgi:hypothetical protein
MAITDYTTSTSIRAVLGVSDDEIENATIEDDIYSVQLDEALYELGPTLAADYATIKAGTQTPQTSRFLKLINTWCAYHVANDLLTSVKMFAPQTIKADKDEAIRVADPYKDLRETVSQLLSKFALKILTVYADLFPAQLPPVQKVTINLISVSLPTDPVTGL